MPSAARARMIQRERDRYSRPAPLAVVPEPKITIPMVHGTITKGRKLIKEIAREGGHAHVQTDHRDPIPSDFDEIATLARQNRWPNAEAVAEWAAERKALAWQNVEAA